MQGSGTAKVVELTPGGAALPVTGQAPGAATTGVVAGGPAGPANLAGLSVKELRALRDEISSQLSNVTGRRADLANQLRGAAPGVDKAGLEGRIALLDKRILDLEGTLNATGFQVAAARGQGVTVDPPPLPGNAPDRDQITAIAIVFTVVVLAPLAWAWARAILRRSTKMAEQPSQHLMQRLDRMEEGIETIALEVERISEGQRFVTKVIGESRGEPLAIPRGESS
jgi:hypothetical protein